MAHCRARIAATASRCHKERPYFPSLQILPEYLLSKLDAGQVLIATTAFVADEERSAAVSTLR
jgi:hypothetical protein